mgnify:FL=1
MNEDNRYYICFTDREGLHFWDVFTSNKFRHCFALRWDGFNWILIESLGCSLEVSILPYAEDDDVPQIMKDGGFLVTQMDKQENNKYIFRGWMTCVTVIKHLLGIRKAWIVTPKQLYKYIARRNHV